MKSLIINPRAQSLQNHHHHHQQPQKQKHQPHKDLSSTEVTLMSSSLSCFIGLSPQQGEEGATMNKEEESAEENVELINNEQQQEQQRHSSIPEETQQQQQQQQQQESANEEQSSGDDSPPTKDDDAFIESSKTTQTTTTNYYRYIIDRTNGTSKLDASKPPCCLCYVPKPVGWFPDWIERNAIFEYLGRKGIFSSSNLRARKYCIGAGLICNIVSAILSFYVLFAISLDFNVIWISAFTYGIMASGNTTILPYKLLIRMGLNAMAIETQYADNSTVVAHDTIVFEDVCDVLGRLDHIDYGSCEKCVNASKGIQFSLFVSFFMSFPSITTSVVRLYPHYDCNCQKIFASFAAIIALAFAIFTFMIYQFSCFRSIATGHICINEELEFYGTSSYYLEFPPPEEAVDPEDYLYYNGDYYSEQCFRDITPETEDDPYFYYYREFAAGSGWIALAISTGLRILDMLFNMAIPTPTICRDREEQRLYEVLVTETEEEIIITTPDEETIPPLSSSTAKALSKTTITTTMTSSDKSKDTI